MFARIQSFAREHLTTLMMLLLAAGFLVVLGELVLYKHYVGEQLIGLLSTVVGTVLVLWGIFAKGRVRVTLATLLVVLSLAGLIGVEEHSASEAGEAQRPTPVAVSAANIAISTGAPTVAQDSETDAGTTEAGSEGSSKTTPPPLAPLGLSGLALMGAVILFAKRDEPEPLHTA